MAGKFFGRASREHGFSQSLENDYSLICIDPLLHSMS
jgi:hypothetical protein